MIVKEFKCQRCGNHFVVEVIDRKDPNERQIVGAPVRCPECKSQYIEVVRVR